MRGSCAHMQRRMNTEWDNVVIHMLSCEAVGSPSSVCVQQPVYVYPPLATGWDTVCVFFFMKSHAFTHLRQNMAGTGTAN